MMVRFLISTLLLLFSLGTSQSGEIQLANHQSEKGLMKVKVSGDGKYFVQEGTSKPFPIWGVNYDHDSSGRLLDEYWIEHWKTVVDDFREIKELGANCVRIHLQLGKFMDGPNRPNPVALKQLEKLLDLAVKCRLYINITGLACYHKSNIPDWFDNLEEQDRWNCQAVFWESIAKTCKNHPAVFCYDLMNEPILPGKEPATDWLAGELGGKFFVQRLSLDLKNRSREQVAEAWIKKMVSSIRKHDSTTLVTVGVIPWVLTWPKSKPLFYSPNISRHLDFAAVHFYPQKNQIDKALTALKAYEIGKPLLVEEMFPLKCSKEELVEFINRSAEFTDGWTSFYWGKTAKELRSAPTPTIAEAITASWLEEFSRLAKKNR